MPRGYDEHRWRERRPTGCSYPAPRRCRSAPGGSRTAGTTDVASAGGCGVDLPGHWLPAATRGRRPAARTADDGKVALDAKRKARVRRSGGNERKRATGDGRLCTPSSGQPITRSDRGPEFTTSLRCRSTCRSMPAKVCLPALGTFHRRHSLPLPVCSAYAALLESRIGAVDATPQGSPARDTDRAMVARHLRLPAATGRRITPPSRAVVPWRLALRDGQRMRRCSEGWKYEPVPGHPDHRRGDLGSLRVTEAPRHATLATPPVDAKIRPARGEGWRVRP